MNFKYALFDLDGTVVDPVNGITGAVRYALRKFGIEETDQAKLNKFIGPPLVESFAEFYGFSEEDSKQAVAYYRETYNLKEIYDNEVYDGIEHLLKSLKENGKQVILATCKPEAFAVRILEHYSLDKYFDCIAGAALDGTRDQKNDVIAYAMERCGIKDGGECVMIGDRRFDIDGGKKFNMSTVAVMYGYGSRAEFEEHGADYIVDTVPELEALLLGSEK